MPEKRVLVEIYRSSEDVFALAIEPPTAVDMVKKALGDFEIENALAAGDLRVSGVGEDELIRTIGTVAQVAGIHGVIRPQHMVDTSHSSQL